MRPAAALLAALFAVAAHAADPKDDPLPAGAKLRLGTDRMRVGHGVLTPDGRHLVTSRNFKTLLLDVTTGRPSGELKHLVTVFSADGKWAASGAGLVNVWELATGKSRQVTGRQFSNVALEPVSLSADGGVLAIGSERGAIGAEGKHTAVVWDVRAGKPLAEVSPEQNRLVGVRISPDGKTLATFGSHDDPKRKYGERNPDGWPEQAVQLWNAADGKLLARVTVTNRTVFAVAFSPDSSLLAVSAGDGLVSLRDPRTGREVRQLFGRSYVGTRLAFSTDGKTLAAAGMDGRVQRWSVPGGKMLGTTEHPVDPQGGHSFRLHDLVFTGPDRAVAWGSMGSVGVAYEVPSGKRLSPAAGHFTHVTSVGFPADGKHVLTSGFQGGVLRWDATTGELVGPVAVRLGWSGGHSLPEVRLTADGARAVSDRTGSSVYDVATGTELFRLPVAENDRGSGFVARLARDGTRAVTRLAAADKEKTDRYEVWDLVAPKKLGAAAAPKAEWGTADVSTDGTRLVTYTRLGPDGDVTGWEVATGKKLGAVSVPGAVTVLAVPGADPLAVAPTKAGTVVVVDYAAGKVVKTLDAGRADMIGSPVFAPDGKSFAAAFWKFEFDESKQRAEVRVYAWPGGDLRHTFRGHTAEVYSLSFSPDGRTLASGSLDTTVLLWDLTTGGK